MKKALISLSVFALPAVAFAQATRSVQDLVILLRDIINFLIPLVIALAVLYIVWGAFQYMRASGENRKEAQSKVLYGIIAIFVMVSIWGLVNILVNTFDLETRAPARDIEETTGGIPPRL